MHKPILIVKLELVWVALLLKTKTHLGFLVTDFQIIILLIPIPIWVILIWVTKISVTHQHFMSLNQFENLTSLVLAFNIYHFHHFATILK